MTHKLLGLVAVFISSMVAGSARAELVTFNLQNTSALTLSGSATVGGNTYLYTAQGANSLLTSYLGSVTADIDNLLNPTSIAFQSAIMDASISGQWTPSDLSPAGPGAPSDANYGMSVNAIVAVARLRNVGFNLAAVSTTVNAGSFAVSGQNLTYTTGDIDVHSVPFGGGATAALTGSGANSSANMGNYSVAGNIATLTIPVTFSVDYEIADAGVTGTNTFTGNLIAVATVPEPSSMTLLALCGAVLITRRRSSRKFPSAC